MHTTGLASDGEGHESRLNKREVYEKSDATLADSKATEKATNPCFSPFDPISMTSLARIFSLIGVIFFFWEAMRVPLKDWRDYKH